MSKLTIYKASAGSGKTFTLTVEFLKLLFKNSGSYRHILAVTFTNKATAEMKDRILSVLGNLSAGKDTPYSSILEKETGFNQKSIKEKAGVILSHILHNYSKFSISTIDSFFQQILRSFTKELGIGYNNSLELNNDQILDEVVSSVFLHLEEHPEITEWILSGTEEQIIQGKSWNLKTAIKKIGYQLFKESYRNKSFLINQKLNSKDFLNGYIQKLNVVIRSFEKKVFKKGLEGWSIIEDNALQEKDFHQGARGIAGFFKKLSQENIKEPNSYVLSVLDNPEKWPSSKTKHKDLIIDLCNEKLNAILAEIMVLFNDEFIHFNTAVLIKKYIYILGTLNFIDRKIKQYLNKKNLFLLSDTNEVLKGLIGGNDAPFIYEKTGYMYRHFMIDEFQDTSQNQWSNFKPLIANSMAENNSNLVVGDVKQSIYRWRNSNWKILQEKINDEFFSEQLQTKHLLFNWRSTREVISFNNSIFRSTAGLLQDVFAAELPGEGFSDYFININDLYSDCIQQVPEGKTTEKGYVKIEFSKKEDYDDWKEECLERMYNHICELQDAGFSARDIAILVRTKKEGGMVADFLQEKAESSPRYNFDIISNEALLLDASRVVSFIISVLSHLINPQNEILKAEIVVLANELKGSLSNEVFDEIIRKTRDKEGLLDASLKDSDQSLTELIYQVYIQFELHTIRSEEAYFYSFADYAQNYSARNGADIPQFIDWWHEEGKLKSVPVDSSQDAIQIMTIHKSKGLEFSSVLIPFCNWPLEPKGSTADILWLTPLQKPFDALELVPVTYSSALKDTIFAADYYLEKYQCFIDSLNLLYVAFTRASHTLWAHAPLDKNKDGSVKDVASLSFSGITKDFASGNDTFLIHSLSSYFDSENNYFEYGELKKQEKRKVEAETKPKEGHAYSKTKTTALVELRSQRFWDTDSKIKEGKMLHKILESIEKKSDLERALSKMVINGDLTNEEAESKKELIVSLLNNKKVADWFAEDAHLLLERDILTKEGLSKRPDRIVLKNNEVSVIDYKYEQEQAAYVKQVKGYMRLLQELGYTKIKGYVWYLITNTITEVEL